MHALQDASTRQTCDRLRSHVQSRLACVAVGSAHPSSLPETFSQRVLLHGHPHPINSLRHISVLPHLLSSNHHHPPAMSRALANGFIKVPKPDKAKPQRDESPLLSKAALRAQQQRSSTPRTPRKATQPTQSASKKRLAQARGKQKPASVAPTPKRDRPIQSLDPSPPPSRKRARHDDYADNPSPASKKRARKEAQEARQRQLLQEEDEDEGEAQVEEDLVLPFWADPLVELNARAR